MQAIWNIIIKSSNFTTNLHQKIGSANFQQTSCNITQKPVKDPFFNHFFPQNLLKLLLNWRFISKLSQIFIYRNALPVLFLPLLHFQFFIDLFVLNSSSFLISSTNFPKLSSKTVKLSPCSETTRLFSPASVILPDFFSQNCLIPANYVKTFFSCYFPRLC